MTTWLAAQTNLQTWSAEVVQTRTLKTLAQPLRATGRVWFAAPDRFRWELGTPPQTIAVRQHDLMFVIYPKLKRAEKYPVTGNQSSQWRDTMLLIETGLPRSQAELESRFRVLSVVPEGDQHEVTLQPRSGSARRMIPEIKLRFATNDASLRATEIRFADGSSMRNEFTNATLNPKLDATLFRPELDAGYQIVEPMKSR